MCVCVCLGGGSQQLDKWVLPIAWVPMAAMVSYRAPKGAQVKAQNFIYPTCGCVRPIQVLKGSNSFAFLLKLNLHFFFILPGRAC